MKKGDLRMIHLKTLIRYLAPLLLLEGKKNPPVPPILKLVLFGKFLNTLSREIATSTENYFAVLESKRYTE